MIVSSRSQYVPPVGGVILIDCWEIDNPNEPFKTYSSNYYQNLINRITQFDIKCVINAMTRSDTMKINLGIEQKILNNSVSFTTDKLNDFVDIYTNKLDSNITHWYLAGQSWQMCVHNNGIGLDTLSELSDINFYADQKSFFKINGTTVEHEDFVNDYTAWQYLPWFGYKLLPQGNNNK